MNRAAGPNLAVGGDPADESLPRCVEHLLGERPGSAPSGRAAIGEWLAARGFALASVADPASFSMAGAFLARGEVGWAVVFGIPPGTLFDPAGAAKPVPSPLEAAVLAPLELSGYTERDERVPGTGLVEAIAIATAKEEPMRSLERARAIAGAGLEGDRYARGEGTFSTRGGSGRSLTLVDSAALNALAAEGIELDPIDARRNLVVGGIDLDALIGRRFRVGAVECLGARRCEPCAHLERLTGPGVLRGLVHRGGLRADLLSDGEISVGDDVVALD